MNSWLCTASLLVLTSTNWRSTDSHHNCAHMGIKATGVLIVLGKRDMCSGI